MKPVFVIDDDSDVREVIVFALESDGHKVMSADNGKSGLEALIKLAPKDYPGLIIVDYLMPEMDGVEFIHKLKDDYAETLGKIPVVFSSALGSVDETDPYLKGITTLYKPMELDDLLKVVKQYCS